jgi:outer membrane protein TolC
MKKTVLPISLIAILLWLPQILLAQVSGLSPELTELIRLSVEKDRKLATTHIDREITLQQRKAVRSSYYPKLEAGGKYVFAKSPLNSELGDITGLESLGKISQLMQSPAFPQMFPGLAGLTGELMQLEQLLASQGLALPAFSKEIEGDFTGNYFGVDVTAKVLLFSGGKVPGISRALNEKAAAQEQLSRKSTADLIAEVIAAYDQLALLGQSGLLIDESSKRLEAEKRFAASALKNGFATTYDTLRIAAAEAALEAKMADFKGKKLLLSQNLARLTGQPASRFSNAFPDLQPLLPVANTSTIANRPELMALQSGLQAQKYMLGSEKSHYLPKVQAFASARYDNLFDAEANFKSPMNIGVEVNSMTLGPAFMAGVGFKWDIFDLSGGSSKVKLAKLEVKKAANELEEARELLELNLTKTTTALETANAQVVLKSREKVVAERALEMASKSYSEGQISISERLAAETSYQQSALEYLQAVYAQRQATIELYRATGDLDIEKIK